MVSSQQATNLPLSRSLRHTYTHAHIQILSNITKESIKENRILSNEKKMVITHEHKHKLMDRNLKYGVHFANIW